MRSILLAIVVLPASIAPAEPSNRQKPDKPVVSGSLLPLKGAASGNSCATYGAGFVKLNGTETCVQIGGAVSIGVGSFGGRR